MSKNITNNKPSKRSLASANEGLSGIDDVVSKGTDFGVWLLKGLVVATAVYIVYGKISNRFIAKKEVSNFPPANVSTDQAKSRADAIYNERSFLGITDQQFNVTAQNLAGLNYNGFIRVYNAFGHRTSYTMSGDMDLIGFLQDQFTSDHLTQLSTLLNGAFFKTSAALNQEKTAISLEFFPTLYQKI